MRDKQQLKIELLSQWMLEAEFRKNCQRWVRVSWSECPDPSVLIRGSCPRDLVQVKRWRLKIEPRQRFTAAGKWCGNGRREWLLHLDGLSNGRR